MSEATKGMGPRLIGEEAYRAQQAAPVVAKNLGFGARMLTDSPDAAAVPEGVREPDSPPRFMGRRQTDQPPHTTDEHRDVTAPLGQPVAPGVPVEAKGYSVAEVQQLCREAPARAQELYDAELVRPDGQRIGALKAIREAAVGEKNDSLAAAVTGAIFTFNAAKEKA